MDIFAGGAGGTPASLLLNAAVSHLTVEENGRSIGLFENALGRSETSPTRRVGSFVRGTKSKYCCFDCDHRFASEQHQRLPGKALSRLTPLHVEQKIAHVAVAHGV